MFAYARANCPEAKRRFRLLSPKHRVWGIFANFEHRNNWAKRDITMYELNTWTIWVNFTLQRAQKDSLIQEGVEPSTVERF